MSTTTQGCGTCTMCCKLMAVKALDKPTCMWCPHARPGAGCGIYDSRPEECRVFDCLWLQTQSRAQPLPLELRPDHSHVVITAPTEGGGLVLHVDPARPDAHHRGAMGRLVDRMAGGSEPVYVVCGAKRSAIRFVPTSTTRRA